MPKKKAAEINKEIDIINKGITPLGETYHLNEAHQPGHPHYEQYHHLMSADTPPSIPITTLEAKRADIIKARDHAREQYIGLENQLAVVNQLLTPEVPTDVEEPPETPDRPSPPDNTI